MKIFYCREHNPMIAVAANDASGVAAHYHYEDEVLVATHTDIGMLDVNEPFTEDLASLDTKYGNQYT